MRLINKELQLTKLILVEFLVVFRYPNIACDMLTSDVGQITDSLVTSEPLMKAIYAFLDTDNELNPLQASFFSKLMGLLITRKSEMVCNALFDDFLRRVE